MSAYLPLPWLVLVLSAAVVAASARAGLDYFDNGRPIGASLLTAGVVLILFASVGVGLVIVVHAGMELHRKLDS